jgi:hypothetical protein
VPKSICVPSPKSISCSCLRRVMGQSSAEATAKKKGVFSERKARESRSLYLLLGFGSAAAAFATAAIALGAAAPFCSWLEVPAQFFFRNASTPGGMVSDPSTEIARQVHSADVRVRILPTPRVLLFALAAVAGSPGWAIGATGPLAPGVIYPLVGLVCITAQMLIPKNSLNFEHCYHRYNTVPIAPISLPSPPPLHCYHRYSAIPIAVIYRYLHHRCCVVTAINPSLMELIIIN